MAGGDTDIAATTTARADHVRPGRRRDERRRRYESCCATNFFTTPRAPSTAADAPRWLTEGVADFVARAAAARRRPTRATDLGRGCPPTPIWTLGHARSLAYDRAWLFSRFVADTYGTPTLRQLYLRACGHGHPDAATAVREMLGADLRRRCPDWRWRQMASVTRVTRVLLVTNDFPPRRGGIQSYLEALVGKLVDGGHAHADGVRAEVEGQ